MGSLYFGIYSGVYANKICLKIIFKIIFFLNLHQNKCQNIGTPPLPSYRATPILIEGTIEALVRVGVALSGSRGRPRGGYGRGPYILTIILV